MLFSISPVLGVHIIGGTLGILSGAAAVAFRKGSRRHARAGNVFVISMLSLAASGLYLAAIKRQPGNIFGGALTFYLVATAWMTATRKQGTGIFDWGGLLVALSVACLALTCGIEAAINPAGLKYGYPPGPYFLLGSVALVASMGDIRLLARGGISGTRRLARHLWRMCFAFFIAAASVLLARPHLFPALLRKTGVLFVLSFLPLILMIFWLLRVRLTTRYQKNSLPRGGDIDFFPIPHASQLTSQSIAGWSQAGHAGRRLSPS